MYNNIMSTISQFRLATQLTQQWILISRYQVIKVCMFLLLESTAILFQLRNLSPTSFTKALQGWRKLDAFCGNISQKQVFGSHEQHIMPILQKLLLLPQPSRTFCLC